MFLVSTRFNAIFSRRYPMTSPNPPVSPKRQINSVFITVILGFMTADCGPSVSGPQGSASVVMCIASQEWNLVNLSKGNEYGECLFFTSRVHMSTEQSLTSERLPSQVRLPRERYPQAAVSHGETLKNYVINRKR